MSNEQRKEQEAELKKLTEAAFQNGLINMENLEKIKENLIKKSA